MTTTAARATDDSTWRDAARPVAERVDALLAEMTLPEKLAQLGSVWLGNGEGDHAVAPMSDVLAGRAVDLDAVFADGLGHFTRIFGTAPLTAADGMVAVRELQQRLVDTNRLGIPAIVHEECMTGFTTLGATTYPTALAWGATFDPDLVGRMAAAIGSDMHAVGVHQGLSPVLDVVRDHRWGRVEETLGEDPYLVGVLATAYVRGLQSSGVDATLKHFAGYSASRAGRNHAPVSMGPREFADVVLPPFEMAVREGGVRSVMNSYTDVDGVPCAGDRALLTDLLRGEWGFDGVVVSDYFAVGFLESMHHVAGSLGEAGALALTAGIDVELPDTAGFGRLQELVGSGALDEAVVDQAVRRVLRQKAAHGLLDAGWSAAPPALAAGQTVELDAPGNRAIARELAESSVVLLANGGTLPLAGPGRTAPARIALVGPGADDPSVLFGCYAFANHVLGAGTPSQNTTFGLGLAAPTLADALRAEFADAELTVVRGCEVTGQDRSGFADATAAAGQADLVVAVVGDRAGLFGRGTSGEGCDAADLSLPGVQGDLLTELLATGTPVVVVVLSGRPYALGAYTDAAATVQAFFPGEEGAGAVAGVLSGRVTPSGRLPVQVARVPGSGPGTYLHAPLGGDTGGNVSNLDPTPLYPFGHGLSYTSFAYSDLALSAQTVPTDGTVTVSATVANTGDVDGVEVVQLYLSDPVASVVRPVQQLVGFARVPLAAGAAARVDFALHADRSAFTGVDRRRVVEPGDLVLALGGSSTDLPLTGSVTLTGPVRAVGADRVLTTPATVTAA